MPADDVTGFYDEFVDYELGYLIAPNVRHAELRARLRPLLTSEVEVALEIGCGIGLMTAWLARHVPRVVGTDISPRSIAVAEAMSKEPEFVVAGFPTDAIPEGPYDLVAMLDVLEHFPPSSRPDVFQRVGEIITDDAILAINVPSKRFALRRQHDQAIDEAIGFDEIVGLAAQLGMEPLRVDRYGVDAPNQYVFGAFSRTYRVDGVAAKRRARRLALAGLTAVNRVRRRRQVERLRRI